MNQIDTSQASTEERLGWKAAFARALDSTLKGDGRGLTFPALLRETMKVARTPSDTVLET